MGQSKVVILCVDDEENPLILRKLVLEKAGYVVGYTAKDPVDLGVTKTVNDAAPSVGAVVTYTVSVKNFTGTGGCATFDYTIVVTSVGTPKAGVFSEGAARVVAARLMAEVQAGEYSGR